MAHPTNKHVIRGDGGGNYDMLMLNNTQPVNNPNPSSPLIQKITKDDKFPLLSRQHKFPKSPARTRKSRHNIQ